MLACMQVLHAGNDMPTAGGAFLPGEAAGARNSPPRRLDPPAGARDSPPRRLNPPAGARDSPPRRLNPPAGGRDSPPRRLNPAAGAPTTGAWTVPHASS